MQVKKAQDNYFCLKHNQVILLVVLDKKILPENQMFCNACIKENRSPLNQALSVEQAEQMIREKLTEYSAWQEEAIQKQLEKLKLMQTNMIELRQQFLMSIDTIIKIIELWIKDLGNTMKYDSTDLLKGLQLLHEEKNQQKLKELNIKPYLLKIYSAFRKLFTLDGLQKCFQDLKLFSTSEQLGSINYHLINQVQQEEYSLATAFNNQGSIMISGCNKDVKLWQFEKGKLTLLNLLQGQGKYVQCLLFSKKEQWFISGNDVGVIQCWKKGKNIYEWISSQALNKHSNFINCIILSKNEDQLISCSSDKNIFVWSTKFETNQINFEYSLQNKHTSDVQRFYFKLMICVF